MTQPQAIIAGLPVDGQLRIVGRSTVLSTRVGRELGRQLRPAQPGHPWPEEISETSLNRFSKDKGPVHLTLVEPIVVEIAADVAWTGKSFRHPLSFRPRQTELDPADVELPPHPPKPLTHPASRWTGCAHWGQVEPSAQLKAVPIGCKPSTSVPWAAYFVGPLEYSC